MLLNQYSQSDEASVQHQGWVRIGQPLFLKGEGLLDKAEPNLKNNDPTHYAKTLLDMRNAAEVAESKEHEQKFTELFKNIVENKVVVLNLPAIIDTWKESFKQARIAAASSKYSAPSFVTLSEREVNFLLVVLINNSSVTSLNLSGIDLRPHISFVAEFLASHPNITSLALSNTNLDDDALEKLSEAMEKAQESENNISHLTSLDFSHNRISYYGFTDLMNLIAKFSKTHHFRTHVPSGTHKKDLADPLSLQRSQGSAPIELIAVKEEKYPVVASEKQRYPLFFVNLSYNFLEFIFEETMHKINVEEKDHLDSALEIDLVGNNLPIYFLEKYMAISHHKWQCGFFTTHQIASRRSILQPEKEFTQKTGFVYLMRRKGTWPGHTFILTERLGDEGQVRCVCLGFFCTGKGAGIVKIAPWKTLRLHQYKDSYSFQTWAVDNSKIQLLIENTQNYIEVKYSLLGINGHNSFTWARDKLKEIGLDVYSKLAPIVDTATEKKLLVQVQIEEKRENAVAQEIFVYLEGEDLLDKAEPTLKDKYPILHAEILLSVRNAVEVAESKEHGKKFARLLENIAKNKVVVLNVPSIIVAWKEWFRLTRRIIASSPKYSAPRFATFSEKEAGQLLDALVKNSSVTSLNLSGIDLRPHIISLAKFLTSHPNLTSLTLSNTNFDDDALKQLSEAMEKAQELANNISHLISLDFSHNQIAEIGFMYIMQLVTDFSRKHYFQRLQQLEVVIRDLEKHSSNTDSKEEKFTRDIAGKQQYPLKAINFSHNLVGDKGITTLHKVNTEGKNSLSQELEIDLTGNAIYINNPEFPVVFTECYYDMWRCGFFATHKIVNHKSIMQPEKELSLRMGFVYLMCKKDVWPGHALICTETLSDKGQVRLVRLEFRPGEDKSSSLGKPVVGVTPLDAIRLHRSKEHYYFQNWLVDNIKIQLLIENAQNSNVVKYSLLGISGGHNCLTWAQDRLKEIGLEVNNQLVPIDAARNQSGCALM